MLVELMLNGSDNAPVAASPHRQTLSFVPIQGPATHRLSASSPASSGPGPENSGRPRRIFLAKVSTSLSAASYFPSAVWS